MILPAPIQNLIDAFSRLPGIGPKTAPRLTFFLLNASEEVAQGLSEALHDLKTNTVDCPICYNVTSAGRTECEICASAERDPGIVCVVEEPLDVLAMERTDGFSGRYHVLRGVLSPIEGVGPEDLTMRALFDRVKAGGIQGADSGNQPEHGRGCHCHVYPAADRPPGCEGNALGTRPANRGRPGIC